MDRQAPTFGQLLRGYRVGAGLTQRELAERSGVSVRALRDIEQDRVRQPRAPSVRRFAAALPLAEPDRHRLLASAGAAPVTDRPAERPTIGVLGPLVVGRGGEPVEIEAPRLRTLLGLLAIQPDRTVPVHEVVGVLWGGTPPATARRLVHAYAGQLRALLEPGRVRRPDPPVLTASRTGFRLALGPEHLDLARFVELVGQAERATEPGAARLAYAEALAGWRGPVLADAEPGLRRHPAAIELTRRHLAATLALADLAVESGQSEEALAALRPVAEAEPLHEGVHARLMLALAGGGQPAAALEVFRTLRARMVDELGIEPGAAVQDAYRRVLRGTSPSWELAVPAQLPPDVPGFTGRVHELGELDRRLGGDALTIAVITGSAGVGKTALAVHWAHRVRDRFPDGQLYLDLRGYAPVPPLAPVPALAGFLRALGLPAPEVPADPAEAAALYRSLLADRRVLVVLDNAHDPDQVRALLPAGPGCLVLVTSRDRLAGLAARDGASRLRLDVLTEAEADGLLESLLEGPASGVSLAEPAARRALAQACARLPLALRVAAANLANRPAGQTIAGYVTELRAGNRLSALASDDDEQAAVRAAFDLSYAALIPPARELFRRLGLVPGPDITAGAAGALLGRDPAEAAGLLDRLAAAHLVDQPAPGRYGGHDLLRLYAAERVTQEESQDSRWQATERLHRWYLSTVDNAARLLYPEKARLPLSTVDEPRPVGFADHGAALAWLEAERPNLLAVIASTGAPVAWRLADALRGYFFLRLNTVDWEVAARGGLAAATAAGDHAGQSSAHLSLAAIRRAQGRYRAAVDEYALALGLARRAGWLDGESTALGNLAATYWQLGRLTEAADHFAQAIALCERTGWRAGQATALGNLGALYIQLGQLHRAGEHYRQALALVRQTGSRPAEAINLANLGEVYHALGQLDLARAHLIQALGLHRTVGGRGAEAEALRILAEVDLDAGDPAGARGHASAALELARATGDRPTEASVLNTVAGIEARVGDPAVAGRTFADALRLAGEIEAGYPEVVALTGLALTRIRADQPARARPLAERAVRLARERGYRVLEGQAGAALATAYRALGQDELADGEAGQAQAILAETGVRSSMWETLNTS